MFKIYNFKKLLFKKANRSNKSYYSYSGLAWELFKEKRYLDAINSLKRSIELKEQLNSINISRNLKFIVNLFLKISVKFYFFFQECIKLLKRCNWSLLITKKRSIEKINSLKKSIKNRYDSQSYFTRGCELLNEKDYLKSINYLKKALELKESWKTYRALSTALYKSNQIKKAKEVNLAMTPLYLKETKPITLIDPFLGNKEVYEQISGEKLREIKSTCESFQINFIPSLNMRNHPQLNIDSWRNLIYLHIPKSGGTSFIKPIRMLKRHLFELNKIGPHYMSKKNYFSLNADLHDWNEVEALNFLLKNKPIEEINSLFISIHGSPNYYGLPPDWIDLETSINKITHNSRRVVCTLRDPKKRLISSIKFHSAIGHSYKNIQEYLNLENSEFTNISTRYISDYGYIKGKSSDQNHQNRNILTKDIDLLDISDISSINKVKSLYLSSSLLPNIVQLSRFNTNKDNTTCRLSDQEVKNIFKQFEDKGFLEKDYSIYQDFLKIKDTSNLNIPSIENVNENSIHPLTFFCTQNKAINGFLIPTKNFIKEPKSFLKLFCT